MEERWVLIVKILMVATLVSTVIALWPSPALDFFSNRWTNVFNAGTLAYAYMERHGAFFTSRIGCLSEAEATTWHEIDSSVLNEIGGPHSLKYGFYAATLSFDPRFEDVEFAKKLFSRGFCGVRLRERLGCQLGSTSMGVQRLVFRPQLHYQTIRFSCRDESL